MKIAKRERLELPELDTRPVVAGEVTRGVFWGDLSGQTRKMLRRLMEP